MSTNESPSYTVDAFCKKNAISRPTLYRLWREGKGPKSYKVGGARRISFQAELDWREALERESSEAQA